MKKDFANICLNLVLAISEWIIAAWMFLAIYGWYLIPLGLPKLTLVQIMGLSLIPAFFKTKTKAESSDEDPIREFIWRVGMDASLWFMGWALHFWL